jgi:polar amino acid transport system substrate-binding protein
MHTSHRLRIAMVGLLFIGCASISTAPTQEARQALAPTGKLRVGLQLGSPHNLIRDPASGEMKGVGYDLGRELARRMGVPFEPITYPSVGALLDAGKAGAWDVAFVGFSPARAKDWDFTALHMEVEFGYLVPAGSSISTMADVDRSGIRVAVQEKSQPDIFVSRTLKQAEVVRAPSLAATVEMLKIAESRRNLQHQAKPVRGIESIAWFSGSRGSARHRSLCHGDTEGSGPGHGLRAQIH